VLIARLLTLDVAGESIETQLVLHEHRVERREAEQRAEDEDERQHADQTDRHARRRIFPPLRTGNRLVARGLVRIGNIAQPLLDEAGELGVDLAWLRSRRGAGWTSRRGHDAAVSEMRSTARRRALCARTLRSHSAALGERP